MPVPKAAKTQISITIDTRLLRRIDAASRKIHSNRSAFIERAVSDSIEEAEQFATVMSDDKARTALFEAISQPGVLQQIGKAMGESVSQERTQQMLAFMGTKKGKSKRV